MDRKHQNAVIELRSRFDGSIPPNYDTDFNLLRWIINAEKLTGQKGSLDMAEKQLRNHLRFRTAMRLDEPGVVPPLDKNPLFKDRLIPTWSTNFMCHNGSNKFLLWSEYKTLDMVGVMKTIKSSDMLVYHFWFYELLLKMVNEQEAKSGKMSGIVCLIDLIDYDFNPFTLLFFNNGQMSHYVNVFHYEHYAQLVYPIYATNVPKWLYLAYKMVKVVLPKDINDRIRPLDHNYKQTVKYDIGSEDLPQSLGGDLPDNHMRPEPARKFSPDEYYYAQHNELDDPPLNQCLHLQISARRRKFVPVECHTIGTMIEYFFTSDAELNFSVFLDPVVTATNGKHVHDASSEQNQWKHQQHTHCEIDTDKMILIKPTFCLGAKFVPERGSIHCDKPGTFYFVFCNKHSWMSRRNVYLHLNIVEDVQTAINSQNIVGRTFSTN